MFRSPAEPRGNNTPRVDSGDKHFHKQNLLLEMPERQQSSQNIDKFGKKMMA
jgi:hypothetical protein